MAFLISNLILQTGSKKMKEDILTYLNNKRERTINVADAENRLQYVKDERKKYFIILIFIGIPMFFFGDIIASVLGLLLGVLVIKKIISLNKQVNLFEENLITEKDSPEYLNGLEDFPEEFYDFETLGYLIYLIQVNRARTLQDAFNLLETMAYQTRQEEIERQNLAYTKEINNRLKADTFFNALTAWAIWKKR